MTTAWSDERLDDELRRFLDLRWHDIDGAPTAADTIRALRIVRAHPSTPRRRAIRVVPLLAAAAILALLVASASFVGGLRQADDSMAPSTPPSPGPVQVSARPPRSSDALPWWTAPTPIGAISWTTDDETTDDDLELKPGIYETPEGFATITSVEYELGSGIAGYRESADGITWRRATAPVPEPRAGPFEHLFAGNEHWIWSVSQLRAWRSKDYLDWSEVDLGPIAPPVSVDRDWSFDLGEPATDGSTVVIPWSQSAPGQHRSGLLVVVGDRVDSVAPPWDTEVALTWAGGRFFALRAPTAAWESRPDTPGAMWQSDDGRTWTDLGQPQGLPAWVEATVGLVDGSAAGTGWPLVAIFDLPEVGADLWGSEDGAAWQWIGRAPGHVFVIRGAFVAIGPPFLAYSIGGRDWQYLETKREPWFGSAMEPRFGSAPPYRAGPETIAIPLESAAWWTVLMRVEADR